jgi:RNA:NAD 2'-phosphotransferase (TPT1/KptA family)
MNEKEMIRISKRLRALTITREQLDEVVETNTKRRFAFDETGTRIRASQGHRVSVDLSLADAAPPDVLYHGTETKLAYPAGRHAYLGGRHPYSDGRLAYLEGGFAYPDGRLA